MKEYNKPVIEEEIIEIEDVIAASTSETTEDGQKSPFSSIFGN